MFHRVILQSTPDREPFGLPGPDALTFGGRLPHFRGLRAHRPDPSGGSGMNSALASLLIVTRLGQGLRRRLPDHHLSADSKDAVKLAMGLVATMTALLLGLLGFSALRTFALSRRVRRPRRLTRSRQRYPGCF